MVMIFEKLRRKWYLIRHLLKYKRFFNESIRESEKVEKIKEFNPELKEIFFQSSLLTKDPMFTHLYTLILNNNYINLYSSILKLRRHVTELFAWMNLYENITDEKEEYDILATEIEDWLTLTCDSIYSFKEKIIYAVVTTAWEYQNLLNEPVDWKFDERNIKFKVLNEKFDHIDEIKKLIVKISKIQKDLGERPLYFRHKHTHRIQPGLEKYGGQAYSIQISKKSRRFGFGRGEGIRLEEIKPKIRESYCDCIDLFYEFENYCVDYLEVKKCIKTT